MYNVYCHAYCCIESTVFVQSCSLLSHRMITWSRRSSRCVLTAAGSCTVSACSTWTQYGRMATRATSASKSRVLRGKITDSLPNVSISIPATLCAVTVVCAVTVFFVKQEFLRFYLCLSQNLVVHVFAFLENSVGTGIFVTPIFVID